MNEKQYEKMIEVENARASENKTNIYECTACFRPVVTIDRDNGVTPMFIACPVCKEMSHSHMYLVDQSLRPTHEFYRPPFSTFKKLFGSEQYHVGQGGLMLRKIQTEISTTAKQS